MNGVEFILARPSLELFPFDLAPAAQRFVDYLEALPYSRPVRCTLCGSRSIFLYHPAGTNGTVRDGFKCHSCRRQFNILTGTPLRLMRHHDKWADWMRFRFSGLSQEQIASLVSISNKASLNWDKVFLQVMADQEPSLHQWWSTHQSLTSITLSPHVEEELEACQQAFHELCYASERKCLKCGASPRYVKEVHHSRRPRDYVCTDCGTTYSNLTGTPFIHLQRMETWPRYLDLLVKGYHDTELEHHFDFSKARTGLWRQAFMQYLKQDWPLLAHWALWMWARRRVTGSPTGIS
ncbi:IS1 family transposase [Halomonas binhaiensis]|uniref:IS1 family transposase n=1 Tax=Halomonas binhaiensis TaxID=2562282 RepID=A0A5C1NEK5_9GAMM|nr:IS1 family transposase [Halomonas binhaiensis]QEM82122.1 IS1 family transposase [Halomonas binhaiensis]